MHASGLLFRVNLMIRYFQKDLPDSPVWIAGHPMRFDFLPTEDPALIAEFENCIRNSVGGISEISKAQFDEEVKKKAQEKLLGSSLNPPPRRQELTAFQFGNPAVAAASRFARQQEWVKPPQPQAQHPMPDPIDVPTAASFAQPPLAKMKDLKAMMERAKPK